MYIVYWTTRVYNKVAPGNPLLRKVKFSQLSVNKDTENISVNYSSFHVRLRYAF